MSTVRWQVEMQMEGANFVEGAELLDGSTPKHLPPPFVEDFQHLRSCTDPCSNNNTITSSSRVLEASQVCYERPPKKLIVEAAASYDSGCNSTSSSSNKSSHKKKHVIAKRKRCAKLNQQFRNLTAIVPGIEKMDQTTVIEESIKYLKQLQERVNTLEEQATKKTLESLVLVKKLHNHSDSDESFTGEPEPEPLPQIEARTCSRKVLIRIHCGIRKGVVVKALEETEKLNLCIVNSSVMPFGKSLEITLVAQMEDEFTMAVKDLVKSLRSSLIQFMGKNRLQDHEV